MKSSMCKNASWLVCLGVMVFVILGFLAPVTAADISFGPVATFGIGDGPRTVALIDLNADGNLDMLTPNSYDSSVSVRMGDGLGDFGTESTLGVGLFPMDLAFADLNGDGDIDLMTADHLGDIVDTIAHPDISVLIGNGDGTFNSAETVPVGLEQGPMSLATGDLDKNGYIDVVSANFAGGKINVFFGDGNGGFAPPVQYDVPQAFDVAIEDLNNDGNPDISVVCSSLADPQIHVFAGNGEGDFENVYSITVGPHPKHFAVEDLNSDGNLDFAVAGYDDDKVYVLLGNGDFTFNAPVGYAAGDGPHGIAVGDLNGDSYPDIAATNATSGSISIFLNDGVGGFGSAIARTVGDLPLFVAIGDLNGDLKPDIAAANFNDNTVSILFNTTPFSYEEEIVEVLEFFTQAVNNESLGGSGAGNSADNRLNALHNMLEEAATLINAGDISAACEQLLGAYLHTDGDSKPKDFVQGEAAEELASKLLELRENLQCSP